MEEVINELRKGLDDLCNLTYKEPELVKIDAIRFVNQYRIMRALEMRQKED